MKTKPKRAKPNQQARTVKRWVNYYPTRDYLSYSLNDTRELAKNDALIDVAVQLRVTIELPRPAKRRKGTSL